MPTMKTLTIGGTTYDLEGGVTSVNGQTGAVVLDASDVGAATEQDIADAIIQVLPVDSASGAVASFPDGYPAPVEALTATITPVQDLHGQTSPYPAGGGKNKFGLEFIQNTTFTLVNGYYRSDVPMCKAGTYKWTGYTFTASVANLAVRLIDGTNPHFMVSSGNIVPTANFVLTSDAYLEFNYTKNGFLSAVSAFKGQLEEGSTATDWSPYSNLCPITGWSEAKVTRTGKNLFAPYDDRNAEVLINNNGQNRACYHLGLRGITVTFSGSKLGDINTNINIAKYKNGIATYTAAFAPSVGDVNTPTVTAAADEELVIMSASDQLYSIQRNVPLLQIQIEVGSTATAYEAYTAETVTIDLSGTRYGGTLDVLTGVLTVTHGYIDLGSLSWSRYLFGTTYAFYADITDRTPWGTSCICEVYPVNTQRTGAAYLEDNTLGCNINSTYIYVRDDSYTDAPTFTNSLSGKLFVYDLATPLTVQLTPAELETILGQNNVWANCGDVAVSYRADIQRYIEKKLS